MLLKPNQPKWPTDSVLTNLLFCFINGIKISALLSACNHKCVEKSVISWILFLRLQWNSLYTNIIVTSVILTESQWCLGNTSVSLQNSFPFSNFIYARTQIHLLILLAKISEVIRMQLCRREIIYDLKMCIKLEIV